MKNLILSLMVMTSAAFATSTTSTTSNTDVLSSMPLSKMFWSLYLERNIIGQNDCSNKCGKYVRALVAAGHQADIVVILPHRSRYLHAIVKLQKDDKITYLDPTQGTIFNDLEEIGRFKELIVANKLDQLGADYK